MKWEDFEVEQISLRKRLDEIKSTADNVKRPQGSSRDQANSIIGQQSNIKNKQNALEREISANMDKPMGINHVGLPWNMPVTPSVSKNILKIHNDNLSNTEKIREDFSISLCMRRKNIKSTMDIFTVERRDNHS